MKSSHNSPAIYSSFIIGIFIFFINCATLQQLTQIQKPALAVKNVRLTDFDFNSVDFAFDLSINNPNELSVSLAGFDYDFLIQNRTFLKGKQDESLLINAKEESIIEIPLALNFQDIYNLYQNVKDKDSLQYQIKFGLDFNLPILGETRIPLNHDGYVPLIRIPKISVNNLRLKKMSLTSSELELNLKISNPNFFEFMLNDLTYDLKVHGNEWASGKTAKSQSFSAKSENLFTIPIKLNFLQMGDTVYRIISNTENIDYSLNGNLNVDTSGFLLKNLTIPFQKDGNIPIIK